MTDWSQLTHAFGTAEDIPEMFNRLQPGQPAQVWSDLWSRLCHQGTVFSASHAALPTLARIAREWPAADRADPLVLAGAIVSSLAQPYGEPDPHTAYAAEIAELLELTEEALQQPGLVDDPGSYIALLEALLAFDGVDVWCGQLDGLTREEFELPCPQCAAENFVVFGRYGYFSTIDDMYMNNTTSKRTPLRPADSAALDGLAKRLRTRVLADGHPDLANKLRYVFGAAECADCGTVFRVDEAVATRWG